MTVAKRGNIFENWTGNVFVYLNLCKVIGRFLPLQTFKGQMPGVTILLDFIVSGKRTRNEKNNSKNFHPPHSALPNLSFTPVGTQLPVSTYLFALYDSVHRRMGHFERRFFRDKKNFKMPSLGPDALPRPRAKES